MKDFFPESLAHKHGRTLYTGKDGVPVDVRRLPTF